MTPFRFALATALLAISVSGMAQTSEQVRGTDPAVRMRAYHELIARYHSGDEGTVPAFAAWGPREAEDVIGRIQTRDDPFPHWKAWQFQSAAMLLTDVIVRADNPGADARLGLVDTILKRGGRELDAFGVAWATATAVWLRGQHRLGAAADLLDHARKTWPDAELWYQSGLTREMAAIAYSNFAIGGPAVLERSTALDGFADVLSDPMRVKPRWATGADSNAARDRARHELDAARDMLAHAVKDDPKNVLARLHLARVLMLDGKADDALAIAARAETSPDAALSFLGSLLAGAAEEHKGNIDAALTHYQHAIDRYPAAQFGYIALAEADVRAGRFDAAREATTRMLERRREGQMTSSDPWWLFAWGSGEGDPFADVRAEARR